MDDPDNTALDALFHRAATHPELRVELCRALLEAELYTLVPRGESTRPAEMIARPKPGKQLQFIRWGTTGKEYYFVFTSPRLARKGLHFHSRTTKQPMVIMSLPGEALLRRMSERTVGIALNPASRKSRAVWDVKRIALAA